CNNWMLPFLISRMLDCVLKDVKGVGMIYLDDKDVIRHRLVKEVIAAYKNIENVD
ncbi:MAG TPA: PhoH family protein, partial [Aequorivita sp.]|nr:PhoH family protein [Aequorivita sp.]